MNRSLQAGELKDYTVTYEHITIEDINYIETYELLQHMPQKNNNQPAHQYNGSQIPLVISLVQIPSWKKTQTATQTMK